jgi:hypothetical protein
MTNIYDQHRAAFSNVSAFVILKNGELIGRVAIKFPRDGAGRLFAYVHILGFEMTRGYAGGGGYDKRSAAVSSAFAKIKSGKSIDLATIPESNRAGYAKMCEESDVQAGEFRALAPSLDCGNEWTRGLENAGFRVLQAV